MVESMGSFKLINESTTDTTTSSYTVQPVEKRNKNPSSLWKYYGIATKENEPALLLGQVNNGVSSKKTSVDNRFLCLLCFQKEKVQLYKKSTSSGNLWRHLNRTHGINIPKSINTAINVISETITPFLEEIDTMHFKQKDEINNIALKTELKFVTNDVIDDFKDIGSLLIEEISKYPKIFENHDSDSTEKYDKIWTEIYENLGKILDIKRLQQIWKNIHDRYIKIRNCEKTNNCFDSSIKFKYYNQLKFLDTELINDDMENDMDDFSDSISIDKPLAKKPRIEFEIEIDKDKDMEEYVIRELPITTTHNLNEANDDSIQRICITNIDDKYNLTSSPISHNYNTNSFEHHEHVQDGSFKILTTEIPCLDSEESNFNNSKRVDNSDNIFIQHDSNNKSDELNLFGRLIAEKMRSIPKPKWDNIQIKILEILRNEQ